MKIYEYVEMDMNGNVIDEISYENDGDLALCKGGGGSSTTTEKPPAWIEQYMPTVSATGWGLTQQPFEFYPNNTIAGFTPEQEQAQNLATQRALSGSPLLGASQEWTKLMFDPNSPAMQSMINQGIQKTMPGIDTSAIQAGRANSDTAALMKGQAMADVAANIVPYQLQAAQFAPMLGRENYFDISQLAGVGQEKQAMEQARVNEDMARWQFNQTEPWERLGMFTNLIQGDYGGNTVTTSSGGGK